MEFNLWDPPQDIVHATGVSIWISKVKHVFKFLLGKHDLEEKKQIDKLTVRSVWLPKEALAMI